jgi:hypothetical protein
MPEVTAVIFSAVYLGATAYITLVEHPARLACSPEVALAQWAQSVKSTPRYAASALIAAAAALVHSKAALGSPWTWGSILLLTVLPFTVVALLPIQRQLAEPNLLLEPVQAIPKLRKMGNTSFGSDLLRVRSIRAVCLGSSERSIDSEELVHKARV